MAYRLEKDSPYNHKKTSFVRRLTSTALTILACGVIVVSTGRLGNMYLINQATENYSNTLSLYDEMVTTTANFIRENGGENPELCFKIYTQLLWNGYFSNGREYYYNIQNTNNIIGNYGARIATGSGDCKNNEDFFCKLMNELGYNAYQVACIQNTSDELSPANLILGNHVITVVEYNGTEYYFDTTNACTYQKVGKNKGINTENGLEVILKPIVSYVYGYNDEKSTIDLVTEFSQNESGSAFLVNEKTTEYLESKKILTLRKQLEPLLQGICTFMTKEG